MYIWEISPDYRILCVGNTAWPLSDTCIGQLHARTQGKQPAAGNGPAGQRRVTHHCEVVVETTAARGARGQVQAITLKSQCQMEGRTGAHIWSPWQPLAACQALQSNEGRCHRSKTHEMCSTAIEAPYREPHDEDKGRGLCVSILPDPNSTPPVSRHHVEEVPSANGMYALRAFDPKMGSTSLSPVQGVCLKAICPLPWFLAATGIFWPSLWTLLAFACFCWFVCCTIALVLM